MNIKLLATLPMVALLAAAPVAAGSMGTTVTEPEVRAPVVVIPPAAGGLGAGAIVGGVVAVAILAALLNDDDSTTTTTTNVFAASR